MVKCLKCYIVVLMGLWDSDWDSWGDGNTYNPPLSII